MLNIMDKGTMVHVVLLPWQLHSCFSINIKLIKGYQCKMEWEYLLQIFISNLLVLVKLSQHVVTVHF